MAIQNNSIQQQAIIANLAALDNAVESMEDEFGNKDESTQKAKPADSVTKQLLEATGKNAGKPILANLLSRLGETFTSKKVFNKLNKEYDFLFENKEEDLSDRVDIRSLNRINKAKKGGLSQKFQDEGSSSEREPEIREYLKSYTSFLVSGGNEIKKKVEKMEQELLQNGKLKLEVLNQVRAKTVNSVRKEVMDQLRRAFYNELFSEGKLEEALAKHGVAKITEWAALNEKIGGEDFGGLHQHLKGANEEAASQVREETRDFLYEKLSSALARKNLTEGKEQKKAEEEIVQLLKLADKAGFDIEGYVKKMPQMLDDLGLMPVIEYSVAADVSADQGQGERKQYQYDSEEKMDILMERIRVLYMQRAVFGDDWRTNLGISVRMMRTKNGLVKLGLRMEDFSKLEKEGRQLAKLKLVQMLREGFEERATYAKLAGPAWKMTEKKIKTILRNLVKLGMEFDDKDIEEMRDEANRKMFAEAEHELNLIESALEVRDTKFLRQKRKTALQILERLSGESNIPWEREKVKKLSIAT